ncbi:hypothetical protein [Chryseobacterium lactis]|uniref:hypothetical protein n=1 Tax=Chryseobacterium lactis TaxID=1241981 RepID=UPI000F4E5213|nr:hypothetical protein [Chryseobacterium lactis]
MIDVSFNSKNALICYSLGDYIQFYTIVIGYAESQISDEGRISYMARFFISLLNYVRKPSVCIQNDRAITTKISGSV